MIPCQAHNGKIMRRCNDYGCRTSRAGDELPSQVSDAHVCVRRDSLLPLVNQVLKYGESRGVLVQQLRDVYGVMFYLKTSRCPYVMCGYYYGS